MRKSIKSTIVVMMLIFLLGGAASALDFTLGTSGALYMSEEKFSDTDGQSILEHFRYGEGIFYGINGEVLFDKWSVGLYSYFSFYLNEIWQDGTYLAGYDMMDADFDFSMGYHIFGAKAFLDPFVEGGIGVITKNINSAYDDAGTKVYDGPPFTVQGTTYWHGGVGVGLNLGTFGFFSKLQYHAPFGTPEAEYESDFVDTVSHDKPKEYPLDEVKFILGLKMFF